MKTLLNSELALKAGHDSPSITGYRTDYVYRSNNAVDISTQGDAVHLTVAASDHSERTGRVVHTLTPDGGMGPSQKMALKFSPDGRQLALLAAAAV